MGNYISCTLNTVPGRYAKGSKVVLPTGDIRQFDRHTNAAELMLDIPGYFLVNSRALHVGRRFSPLSADEELEIGNVYVLFPMRRLNSVVTAADMGTLLLTAKRTSGGKARILPEFVEAPAQPRGQEAERDAPRLSLEEMEEDMVGEFKARVSVCRSRKPMLETIIEEPIPSRRQSHRRGGL